MSERLKFEIVAIMVRIAAFATPMLLVACGWLHNETRSLRITQHEMVQWKEGSDKRESAAADKIKMEIMGIVNQNVGAQYLEIRTAIAVMQEQLAQLTKSNERRDARDERGNTAATR